MEEDQLQKRKGRPKGKKQKGKKSSDSQSPENSDPESGSKVVKGKKCKRGYKFCRGEKCGQMVHIHNKKCPLCGFEFEVKPAGPSQEEELLELEKQNKQSKKIKPNEEEKNEIPPLPERKVMKKSFYRDTYIINYCLLFEATQNLKERIMPEADLQDKITYKDLNLGKMSPCSLFFSSKGNKLAEGDLNSNESKAIDFQIKKNIKEFVINTGLPINSVSWAYRGKNNIQDEPSRTQFFAVAHSLNSVEKLKSDDNAYITLKALNMESFHKFGTVYDGSDYIGVYKIDFDDKSQSFGVPKLIYFLEHKGGSCMELKWLPVNSSSSKEIGVLGLLTSDGKISIYSMPNVDNINPFTKAISLSPILEISIENVYFTQFSWYPLCPFDKLLVGDIVGNIYLYQIKVSDKNPRMSASWIKLYQMAHTRDIKDLKWVPNFDSNGEMLFASCSEDGDTKIWNVDDTSTPLHIFSPTKRPLYSLLWDLGMSYLLTNGEGPALSTKILSFQNIKKFLQNLKEGTKDKDPIVTEDKGNIENLEMKYVTSFETTLKSTSSPFSPYIASSDLEGRIIYYNSEELRSNLIYGSKKTRNDEIEILSETELDEKSNPVTFSINYKEHKAQTSKTEKNDQEKKGLPHHRVAINALEMNPNHLLDQVKEQKDLVHSMLASGNYLGILRVAYFYKP